MDDLRIVSVDDHNCGAALEHIVAERGTCPEFIRCDNGPELTANALQDWCRFSGASTSYIEGGSQWQNPWVESYCHGNEPSSWPSSSSTRSWKPRCFSAIGERSTTITGLARPSACSPQPGTPRSGAPTSYSSHSGLTRYRGQVNPAHRVGSCPWANFVKKYLRPSVSCRIWQMAFRWRAWLS